MPSPHSFIQIFIVALCVLHKQQAKPGMATALECSLEMVAKGTSENESKPGQGKLCKHPGKSRKLTTHLRTTALALHFS